MCVCLFVCLDGFFPLSFYFFFQETKSCSRNHSVIQFGALRALNSGIITEWRLMIPFEEVFSLPQNEGFHNPRKDLEQKKLKTKRKKKGDIKNSVFTSTSFDLNCLLQQIALQ